MCQAHEAEKRSVMAAEEYAARRGYEDAKAGKPCDAGPTNYADEYSHGYRCFVEGVRPYWL